MGWPYDDDECPSRATARRRGASDFERGRSSYEDPYRERARESFDGYEWRQASRAWEDGHRSARHAKEERQEGERRRQQERDTERRLEEQRLEEARMEEEERAWREQQEEFAAQEAEQPSGWPDIEER